MSTNSDLNDGPNNRHSQDQFWNGLAGETWVLADEENERHTGPFGDAALRRANPALGEKVLDVGCGCGSTSLALARLVAGSGEVTGVDLSGVMLQRARQRAKDENPSNLNFLRFDAEVTEFPGDHVDLVFSRFGVMFFKDPKTAFSNLRSTLRPAGRIVFVCWQVPKLNPSMALPNRAALQFFGLSAPAHDAPGPFSLADPNRIQMILADAGFSSIEIEGVSKILRLAVGMSIDQWVHERLLMGLAGELYRDSSAAIQSQARRLLASTVEPYEVDDGLEMSGAAWVVSARN
jgi:SAM-dependent methyltransferase